MYDTLLRHISITSLMIMTIETLVFFIKLTKQQTPKARQKLKLKTTF